MWWANSYVLCPDAVLGDGMAVVYGALHIWSESGIQRLLCKTIEAKTFKGFALRDAQMNGMAPKLKWEERAAMMTKTLSWK